MGSDPERGTSVRNAVDAVREGPARSGSPLKTIEMIPLGCAHLRISVLPVISDRLAEESIDFTAACTPNPKCAPSRPVTVRGRNSWQLGAAANHWPFFPEKFKMCAGALDEHGCQAACTGKGWGTGGTRGRNMTGGRYERHRNAKVPGDPGSGRTPA